MNNWDHGYIDANGIRIHYYRTGGNKPQVVLNHGVTDDGLCWTRVAKALEEVYDVIMLDARGHGMSDAGHGDYTSQSRAADLIGVIETLGLDKPVIGGHSMGADTSLNAAAMRPDLISGVYLEDPPITFPGEPIFGGEMAENPQDVGKLMIRMMTFFKYAPKFIGRSLARKMMPVSPPDEIEPWLDSKKRVSRDLLRVMSEPDRLIGEFDFDLLDQVKTPTMLIYGDRDSGAIISHAMAEEMSRHITGLRVVHLAGANHDIRRMRFDGYMEALHNFLNTPLG